MMSEFVPSRSRRMRSASVLADELGALDVVESRGSCCPSSATSALVASSWMKTSSSILLRTSLVFAVAARTTGMKTPSTSVVIRIVANAARLGAALRRSARSASRRKKPSSWPHRRRRRLRRAANSRVDSSAGRARALVADDAALAQLDHAAPHPVHHVAVVGGDDHRRAGAVHPVEQLHDADRGLGVEVARSARRPAAAAGG